MRNRYLYLVVTFLVLVALGVRLFAQNDGDEEMVGEDKYAHMEYLGNYGEIKAYCPSFEDSIYFSDGRSIVLRYGVGKWRTDSVNDVVTLEYGVQSLDVPIGELYHVGEHVLTKSNVYRHKMNYYYNPAIKDSNFGYFLDLEIPKGNSASDRAIRVWIMEEATTDIFEMLIWMEDSVLVAPSNTLEEMISGLEQYQLKWNMEFEKEREDLSSYAVFAKICVSCVVDTGDYATYHYYAYNCGGGAHGNSRSFYVTYNKNLNTFVTADNTVKSSKQKALKKEVIKAILTRKGWNADEIDAWVKSGSETIKFWDDPNVALLGEGETNGVRVDDFELQNLAIMPTGVAVSYQRYQLGPGIEGEYHILIPYDKVKDCLKYDYKFDATWTPKLDDFLM